MAVLDNRSRLLRHIAVVHAGPAEGSSSEERNSIYRCEWLGCKKSFDELERFKRHLERHVTTTVSCVYQGCEQQFMKLQDLLQHWKVDHKSVAEDDICQVPSPWRAEPQDLPYLPESVPSYLTTNLHVHAGVITKEHRKKLGPWILLYNYGLPNLWRYNIAQSNNADEELTESPLQTQDEYDFLMSSVATTEFHSILQTRAATRAAASGERCIIGKPMPKER